MPDPVLTRRERIMREVVRRARSMQAGSPPDDPYQVTFGIVTRGASLEPLHQTVGIYALAVLDSDELPSVKIQQYVRRLTVVLEFLAWVDEGEEPSEVGNRVLGDLQRKFREDLNLTEPDDGIRTVLERQLSENVEEVRSQLFIDGYADRRITGALFLAVTYKTAIQDPRLLVASL